MFQMGGVGPMLGQNHHFRLYAPEKIDYAVNRYTNEAKRIYGVMDRQLAKHPFIAGKEYTIADIATYHKKPALNIIDAYRIMKSNGPQGKSEADVVKLKSLIISPDYVAADTAAVKLFSQVQPTDINTVRHISLAEKAKVGTQNLDKLNVKRIKMN